jgi:hypothetical protein
MVGRFQIQVNAQRNVKAYYRTGCFRFNALDLYSVSILAGTPAILTEVFSLFSPDPPGQFWDSTSIRVRPLPSKSLRIYYLSYHPTVYSFDTKSIVNNQGLFVNLVVVMPTIRNNPNRKITDHSCRRLCRFLQIMNKHLPISSSGYYHIVPVHPTPKLIWFYLI